MWQGVCGCELHLCNGWLEHARACTLHYLAGIYTGRHYVCTLHRYDCHELLNIHIWMVWKVLRTNYR
mgnify:CR=1 FL=1